jgi:Glycosyl transferase family group 2
MDWTGAFLAFLLLPALAVSIDALAAARSRRFRNLRPGTGVVPGTASTDVNEPFEVLVPIYGDIRYLTNVDYLRQYGRRVILCTTSGESGEFRRSLREISAAHGFRVSTSGYSAPPSNGRRRTGGTIRDRVIRDALDTEVTAKYVVCLDADTTSASPLGELVNELHRRGDDIASIELVPQHKGPLLVQLQRHEYRLAMRLRYLLPWLLSGACHVAKASALRNVMGRHSLFFQGNDVETGLIGERLGYRMTHIPFVVHTEVPSTWRSWWRQRLAWAGGEFRLYVVNIRLGRWHPYFWIYGAVVLFAFFFLRWAAVLQPGGSLLVAALLYFGMVYAVHWKHRNAWLLLMPFYTLLTSLILLPLGVAWYFAMAIPERNFGVIRFRRGRYDGATAMAVRAEAAAKA